MKKLFVGLLVLGILASVSYSAKIATVAKPADPGIRYGLGVNSNGTAFIRFSGETYYATAGLAVQTTSGNTLFALSGSYCLNLTGGSLPTHAGGGLTLTSANNYSQYVLSAIYGAETKLTNDMIIGLDIYPVSFSSTSNAGVTTTTLTFLTGVIYATYLL